MNKQYKAAVFIGRFQPMHNAHLEIIKKGLEIAEKLIIIIGSANKPETILNPWDYTQRQNMLKNAIKEFFGEPTSEEWTDFPKESILDRVLFTQCRDYLYNDYKWSTEVYTKALASGATTDHQTALLGCMKDDSSYYLKMFPMWSFNKSSYMWNLDSTDIRTELFETKTLTKDVKVPPIVRKSLLSWATAPGSSMNALCEEHAHYRDYKKQWENAPYTPTFNTVDALVIKSGCILLIKRKFHPGKGLWALPGGFLDTGEKIEDAALRELKEETRIKVHIEELRKNIETMQVFDHPKRSLRGRTITFAHLINLGHGPLPDVKANSDASGAFWVPMADVMRSEELFFEDHSDIIHSLTSKF